MPFSEAIRTCLTRYAVFTGRASRPEYWWFVLFVFLVQFGIAMLLAGLPRLADLVSGLATLVLILPLLAAGARRLHDSGRSGWWLLVSLVPLIGTVLLIFFLVQPGEDATNAHGPPPAA